MKELESSINPITPSSLIAYVDQITYAKDVLQAEQADYFETEEEFIYNLTHYVNNKKHTNGRIYMKIEKDGTLFANSVSPYSEDFFNNIEEKIKPLVTALHKKRYLTYSSCEGHDRSFRRYVGLAFADPIARDYVSNYIKNLKIKGIKIKYSNSVSNQNIDSKQKKKTKVPYYISKFNPETLKISEKVDSIEQINQYHAEAQVFNIQFHRKYERYYFMEIIILEEVPFGKEFWKHPFKNTWLCFMKKYYWDKITDQLTNAINDRNFKKYLN